jgi:hypothetical protein
MSQRASWILSIAIVLGLAACGGGKGGPAVTNQPGAGKSDDPVAALEALARAIDADDGKALAALAHPTHGITLWFTPGAGYAVFARVEPTGAAPPSTIGTGGDDEDGRSYWKEHYWPSVKRHVAEGIAVLDREPADPNAEIYGTCDEDEEAPTVRAYLVSGRDDQLLHDADLSTDGNTDPATVIRDLTVFHHWAFSVYLARLDGQWRIVHVLIPEPCSA